MKFLNKLIIFILASAFTVVATAGGVSQAEPHSVINHHGVAVGSITSPNAMGSSVPFIFLAGSYVNHWRNTSSEDFF